MSAETVHEIFDPSARWIVVRNFPCDTGGYEPVTVYDLRPLSARASKSSYRIAHNGKRFAPSLDLAALARETGRAKFQVIALRLMSAEAVASIAYEHLCRPQAERDLEQSIRDLKASGCDISTTNG